MEPISRTVATLVGWFLLAILIGIFLPGHGGDNPSLEVLGAAFTFAPIIGGLTFAILLFRNKIWLKKNKVALIIFGFLLLIWLISSMFFIIPLILHSI